MKEPWLRRLKSELLLSIGKSKIIYKIIEVLTVEHCDGNTLSIYLTNCLSHYQIFSRKIPLRNKKIMKKILKYKISHSGTLRWQCTVHIADKFSFSLPNLFSENPPPT